MTGAKQNVQKHYCVFNKSAICRRLDLFGPDHRVVHLTESFGTFRIGPIRKGCSSVLELPTRTIYSSQTRVGDELLIRPPEEMQQYLEENQNKKSHKTASG
jgi:hypothetical protein